MEFALLGFSDIPNLQMFLFVMFLFIYVVTLMGNGIIILITRADQTLQTPMYFFLSNFSFLEICYVSITLPRMLINIWTQKTHISLFACATQMSFVLMFGNIESLLLTVMAYECYVAICNPLHYPLIMNSKVCAQLVAACWVTGVPVEIGQTCQIFSLPFSGSNQINHYFCDIPPMLNLACGDTFLNEMLVITGAVLFVMIPFLLILGSYSKITTTILKLPSATGRAKAFSTCSFPIMVVTLFFGSGIIIYLLPNSKNSSKTDKFLSLLYTILTLMFNPLIYTLRNKDVLMALRKLLT
ncbi:olfactory receptor 10AG1-like [Hippopotamus amphibius kiboko]|uniref:olfactory receptor 10AG1-like n=1 Tax=Hippopotamus amphibius kiboko TaxID=575201 RepID=UPI0025987C78|nr:olfactory receptor 10AG1-like [Hippopotamus amphibius kiboko]